MSAAVALRRAILGVARNVGAFSIVGNSSWRKQRLLILGYHGISIHDEHLWDSALFMPQSVFRQRMETLKRENCSVLPLDEAVERLYSGDLPPRAVALTFDDGFRDFKLRALPVLQEFGYRGAVYLTTYYSIKRHPIFNIFYPYLLWKCARSGADPSQAVSEAIGHPVPLRTDTAKLRNLLLTWMQQHDPSHERKHQAARLIAESAGIDYAKVLASGVLQLMSPDEVQEISRHGIAVELHTHRHTSPKNEDLFKREVRQNRDLIMRFAPAQPQPVHFCYPSGVHFPELYPWLDAEGVRSATTCKSGLAERSSHRLRLPRLIDTCSITQSDFEGWVSGASHMLPRRS
jgi:peptidoglycan/xylan/chitin deacetylase (PgdA/CDA1 family)